jgi:threonyl-tRNA synthetase
MSEKKKLLDHREIAKNLDLYFLDEKVGQGLPLLLPNYTIIHNQIKTFLQAKQKEFNFQEVMTPILGSEDLYRTSGHLAHYEEYMFPVISRNNENLRLRPMTCPHHCSIYQQKPRSYQELPLRLCENSLLFRYEASGGLKGLERPRGFELPDHHIFVSLGKLKEELKVNYLYISQILATFGLKITRLALSTHDLENQQKYHSDKKL